MKNAKKLALLVLSLVLLVCVFAIGVFAEEENATVVYPDGSTETYAVGETIVPKEFTDGLYYGEGNTLYKDDAEAGWIFTVEGGEALADGVVPEGAAGKKIIASGVDKVYYVAEETVDGTTTTVYSLNNDVHNYFSTSKPGDKGDGTNTGAKSFAEVYKKTTSVVLKLYEDVDVAEFKLYWLLPDDGGRLKSSISAYFDLNGHTVINRVGGSQVDVCGLALRLYSSQPGAHWYQPNTMYLFRANNDGAPYVGNDARSGSYADNISIHCQSIAGANWGSGMEIWGGHYYQLAGSADNGFLRVSRRIYNVLNAKFYPLAGYSVFSDEVSDVDYYDAANGKAAIKNCVFYGADTSAIVTSEKSAKFYFSGCTFYGFTASVNGSGTGVLEAPAEEKTVTTTAGVSLTLAANTFVVQPVTYKSATWADGTVSYFLADTIEEAKAFVENHPMSKIAPYYETEGNCMYYVAEPIGTIEYDASFNAVQTRSGERQAVYYSIYRSDVGKTAYVLENNLHTLITQANFATGVNATIKLYQDITATSFSFGTDSAGNGLNLDLNGHTVSVRDQINISWVTPRIYSSIPGARFYCTGSTGNLFSSANANLILGTDENGNYGKNISFYAKSILSSTGEGRYTRVQGGSYYQTGASAIGGFFGLNGSFSTFRNAKVYLQEGQFLFTFTKAYSGSTVANGTSAIQDCNIYAVGTANIANASVACAPAFEACNLINMNLKLGGNVNPTYKAGCYSNMAAAGNVYTEEEPLYTVRINPLALNGFVTEDGTPIAVAAIYKIADSTNALKISATNIPDTYWEVGTDFVENAGDFTLFENGKFYADPCYDAAAIAQIVDGKVAAAGEAVASIVFATTDDVAFTYSVGGTEILVCLNLDCGGEEGVFDKFYELFNAPAGAYTIKMYTNMTMTKAMGFGPFMSTASQPYYNALANGNITLDLNGCTITVAANVKGINMSNADSSAYGNGAAVFGLEGDKNGLFTLKSSKEGGKIVNLSKNALVCIGEYDKHSFKIEGENLTVVSEGPIFACLESSVNSVTVDGGTYIYNGDKTAFVLGGTVSIKDATIVLTNAKAYAPISGQNYPKVDTAITVSNTKFFAENAKMFSFAYQQDYREISSVNSARTLKLSFTDCVFAGVSLFAEHAHIPAANITFAGNNVVSRVEDLALLAKPEGAVAAFGYVTYGEDQYKIVGYVAAANAGLVNWGFGIEEYWMVGSKATHEDVVIDDCFAYEFASIASVAAGENVAEYTLVGIRPGTMQMSLTLKGSIGLNIFLTEALADAIVTIDGEEFTVAELLAEDAYYKLSKAISPSVADEEISVVIALGDNEHEILVSIGDYAKAILASEDLAAAHNLTYAMAQYVNAMTGADILDSMAAPVDYAEKTLEPDASLNAEGALKSIRFNLANMIAIEVLADPENLAELNGKTVTLKLASGRTVEAVIEDGTALFADLFVDEFYGDLEITLEGEDNAYAYNLARYLAHASAEEQAVVQALYAYTFYAAEYRN